MAEFEDIIEDNYFAAATPDKIADVCYNKVIDWMKFTQSTSHFSKIEKAYHMYYGMGFLGNNASHRVTQTGPLGQYSMIYQNEFRRTIKEVYNLVVQPKLAFDCRGSNTDRVTTEACILGNQVLDYVMREKKVSRTCKRAAEYAAALSEGFVVADWDFSVGRPFMKREDGSTIYEGDVVVDYLAPWDVVRDPWRRDEKLPWVIVIRWKNKYDLMAKYPEKADEINSVDAKALWLYRERFYNRYSYWENDLIPEMTMYHEPTPALPGGKKTVFLSSDLTLFDGPLPLERVPVSRVVADQQAETPFGYTFAFDLLGIQDMANILDSITCTNQKTFGVGIVKIPEGANIRHQSIAEGIQAIVVNEKNGRMEPMNFTSTPAELFNFRRTLSENIRSLAGSNSVVAGVPDPNIQSGNFAALMASMAYQFSTQFQESYAEMCQDVAQTIMELYQKFASNERKVAIVGKDNEYMVQSFDAEALAPIKTVTVDLGNSSARTIPGRMQMAEDLLNKGIIKDASDYAQIIETGRVEHLSQAATNQSNTINRENELLRKGNNPPVLVTDDDSVHVAKHVILLNDPDVRMGDPELVASVLAHIQDHIVSSQNKDPMLATMLKQQVFSQGPGPMPGGEPAPSPGTLPPEGGDLPGMPSLPNDPLNGAPPPVQEQLPAMPPQL